MSLKKVSKPKEDRYPKRKRTVMTLEQKLEILNKLETGMSCSAVGRLYQTNESTIRTIKQNEEAIRNSIQKGTPSSSKVVNYKKREKSQNQKKRAVLTSDQKLDILDKPQAGMTSTSIGRLYHTSESTIRSIKQKKETIQGSVQSASPSSSSSSSSSSSKNIQDPKIDQPRKRRVVMTLEQKIEILDKIKAGLTCSNIGRLYHTNESTIRTIKQNERAIRDSIQNGTPSSLKVARYPRNKVLEQTEQRVVEWIKSTDTQIFPSATVIQRKAKELYENLAQGQKCDSFCASKSWYMNFKKRFYHQCVKPISDKQLPMAKEGNNSDSPLPDTPLEHAIEEPKDLVFCVVKEEPKDSPLYENNFEGGPEDETTDLFEERIGDPLDEEFSLECLTQFLWKAKELRDYVVDLDPDLERSTKFTETLLKALIPYQVLQDTLMPPISSLS